MNGKVSNSKMEPFKGYYVIFDPSQFYNQSNRICFFRARISIICCLIAVVQFTFAQKVSEFNPHEAFALDFYPYQWDEFRTADGRPGPKYWQNRADYKINASLNDENQTVTGNVRNYSTLITVLSHCHLFGSSSIRTYTTENRGEWQQLQ